MDQFRSPNEYLSIPLPEDGSADMSTFAISNLDNVQDDDSELGSGITNIVYDRGVRALRSLLKGMSQADLEEAAKEPSDPEVIIRVLEFSKFQSPVTKARLRAASMKLKLLERGGGTYGVNEVADLLGVQRQTVNKRVKAKTLLALDRGKHGYVYPAWQFVDGDTLPGLDDVLKNLDPTMDPWMVLAFFLNSNAALEGSSPLEALRQGNIDSAVRAAHLHGAHGAP